MSETDLKSTLFNLQMQLSYFSKDVWLFNLFKIHETYHKITDKTTKFIWILIFILIGFTINHLFCFDDFSKNV